MVRFLYGFLRKLTNVLRLFSPGLLGRRWSRGMEQDGALAKYIFPKEQAAPAGKAGAACSLLLRALGGRAPISD